MEEKAVSTLQLVNATSHAAEDEEIEIDLLQLLMAIRQHLVAVIVVALLFAGVAGGITKFFIAPTYTSTASMLVLTKETTLSSLADLQLGSKLTVDYSSLIRSRQVLETVIANLQLPGTYRELRSKISITNPTDSRILQISVVENDPMLAKQVVDELADVSAAYISDIMEMTPPKVFEDGEVPLTKTGPNTKRNVMVGFLLGFVLAAGLIVLREIMNDSIVSEEDVERYLGLTTLASLPDKEQAEKPKKSKKVKGKDKK